MNSCKRKDRTMWRDEVTFLVFKNKLPAYYYLSWLDQMFSM